MTISGKDIRRPRGLACCACWAPASPGTCGLGLRAAAPTSPLRPAPSGLHPLSLEQISSPSCARLPPRPIHSAKRSP